MVSQKNLANPSQASAILEKFGIKLTKAFGQNFLIDGNILRKIIAAAKLLKTDNILEVGPGIGTLSSQIAPLVNSLSLIELDKKLIPVLNYTIKDLPNYKIINQDALKLNCADLKPKPNKMVSNLPYNIASPLIIKLLKECPSVETFVLMVQKEAADRFVANVGTKEYGALTLKIHFFCEIKKLFAVSKNVFMPKPKVDSAVILLKRRPQTQGGVPALLFELIEEAFKHRRKTIKNALSYWKYSQDQIGEALEKAKIEPILRPQQVDLGKYQCMARHLKHV